MKRNLAAGGAAYGSEISRFRSDQVPGVYARAGLDFVFIDTEHTTFNRETVADMIRESEERQDSTFDASLRQLRARAEAQRAFDLARVSAGLAYVDGRAGLQAARTTELVGHLLEVSQQK